MTTKVYRHALDLLLDGYAPDNVETLKTMKTREVYSRITRNGMVAEQLGVYFPLKLIGRKELRELRKAVPPDKTPLEISLDVATIKGQAKPLHHYAPDSDVWFDSLIGSLYFGGSDDLK